MKKIDISTKKHPCTFALVDDSDYEEFNAHKWGVQEAPTGKLYAIRSIRIDGKRRLLYMHIEIMGRVAGKEIDHQTSNTLDNQRRNLRHCTHAENMRNRGPQSNNKSGYKGVYRNKSANQWQSCIRFNGKAIHLGLFSCLIKAAKAYDKAARKHFGEFARLNFPENK